MFYNPLRVGLLWLAAFILLTGWFFFEQEGPSGGVRAMAMYAGCYLFFGVVTNALTQARITQRQNARLLGELQARTANLKLTQRRLRHWSSSRSVRAGGKCTIPSATG